MNNPLKKLWAGGLMQQLKAPHAPGKISLTYGLLVNLVLIFVFHIIAARAVDQTMASAFKVAVWYALALLLPGAALHQLLVPRQNGFLAFSALSYVFGYCYSIFLYFLTVPLGLQGAVPYLTVGFAAIAVWILIKYPKPECLEIKKADWPVIALFFVYLFICFVAYSGYIVSPAVKGTAAYHADQVWWVENAIALAKEFPPADLRIHGATLYYHYFASIQLAVANLATGVDMFTLSSAFYPLMKCFVFFGGLYVLLEKVIHNRAIRLLGMCLVLLCTGFERFSVVSFSSHTLTNPFGCDISFGIGAVMLYLFYLQFEKKSIDYKLWLGTVFCAIVCSGIKAPVAVVVIAAMGLPCVVWFFSGRFKISLFYGVGLLAAFFGVSILCAGLLDPELARTGSFSLTRFAGYVRLQDAFPQMPAIIKWAFAMVIHIICIHPLVMILFITGGLYTIIDGEHRRLWNFGMLFGGACGILLGAFNIQNGSSQMYFSMAACLPALLLGMGWLDRKWVVSGRSARIFGSILCSLTMLFQMVLLFHGSDYISTYEYFAAGWNNITYIGERPQSTTMPATIQRTDLEAMEWIRDNTPSDSVLLADRGVVTENSLYMYYGTFSERQMLLEGDVYYFHSKNTEAREAYRQIILDVFANVDGALARAKEAGATHIIQTKWITPDFMPDPELVTLVYETETIAVWELTS